MSKALPKQEIDRMASLYVGGMSTTEVGKIIGRTARTVLYHLRRHGIRVRSRADGVRLATPKIVATNTGRKKGPMSDAGRENVRRAKLAHGEIHAKGFRIMRDGYVQLTRGPHKGRLQHIVVMEAFLGHPIPPGHDVHHVDRNRQNNDLSNLQLLTRREHVRLHWRLKCESGTQKERDKYGRFT
jgi:hypothetical protein